MKEIRIAIPEKKDLMRWAQILRFKVTGGFSCTTCGAKSYFNHVQFDAELRGKRFMLENRTAGICADCTINELNKKADIVFTEDNCTCDWCGEHKFTTSFPRHDDLESTILFGGRWWNGHHICQSCLNLGFTNRGPVHSSRIKRKGGKIYNANELGLWIEVK